MLNQASGCPWREADPSAGLAEQNMDVETPRKTRITMQIGGEVPTQDGGQDLNTVETD